MDPEAQPPHADPSRGAGRRTLRLGQVAGIPIGVDSSWFVIFALLTWLLATNYFRGEFPGWPAGGLWLLGAVTALLFFGSVLLHELGHSVLALRAHVAVRSITLFIFGGVARIDGEPPGPAAELRIALAGPLVSFALALLFYGLRAVSRPLPWLYGIVEYLAYINLALALFNLIPGYPLDGGRVLRALIWACTHDLARATRIAAAVGLGFGLLFIAYGAWQIARADLIGGLWIAFIGWFLSRAARSQAALVRR